jgi:hypothetical protein
MSRLTAEEYQMIALLGRVKGGKLPISNHAIRRLKERRSDVTFEEAVSDAVSAWTQGIDMTSDHFHLDLLGSIVKRFNPNKFRYMMYKKHLYIFDVNRVLVTVLFSNKED